VVDLERVGDRDPEHGTGFLVFIVGAVTQTGISKLKLEATHGKQRERRERSASLDVHDGVVEL
jgi:hypothetical protein